MMMDEAMGGDEDVTDESTILHWDDVGAVKKPAAISNPTTGLSMAQAEALLDLIDARASNRKSGLRDTIIVLDKWALDPKYGPIVEHSHILLVGKIEDYSDKAYYTEGAYEVLLDGLMDEDEQRFTKMLEVIDETDDGANERGRKFLPKSAVAFIGSVES